MSDFCLCDCFYTKLQIEDENRWDTLKKNCNKVQYEDSKMSHCHYWSVYNEMGKRQRKEK